MFLFVNLVLAGVSKGDNIDSGRLKLNFNPGWKLYHGDTTGADQPGFNDSQWQNITLPHASNEDDAFKLDIHNLSTGISWYRKTF